MFERGIFFRSLRRCDVEQRTTQEAAALGRQYTTLFEQVSLLHLYWGEFLELFGTNDKRIERLNQSAPGFFRMLQEQQFETNMLHMARLTDSPKSVGKDNLTVFNLPNLVADANLKKQVTDLLKEVRDKTAFCRDWRNRRFAHHDLLLATGDGKAVALKAPTKEKVSAALEALDDVLNAIERHYYCGMCDFTAIPAHKGAATFYSRWDLALKHEKRWRLTLRAEVSTILEPPKPFGGTARPSLEGSI